MPGNRPSSPDPLSGLLLYRASRLEALLLPLQGLLDSTWPDNVLLPQTLIAAHAGMRQWLNAALAQRLGSDGISANLDIVLASTWIERLAHAQLRRKAIALPRYQRQHLRWAVHAALLDGARIPGLGDPRLLAYLADSAAEHAAGVANLPRRRFQLADHLARLYSQYLIYRPDWLHGWEQGDDAIATRGHHDATVQATERLILAPLWRHLSARLGLHRGDAVAELVLALNAGSQPLPAIHLFGINHLPPSELALARAYARRGLVAIYAPDPCREYWGGISDSRPQLRQYLADEVQRIAAAGDGDYWVEQGHPLLARWGRMGQHFFCALADGEVREDVRHHGDDETQIGNRLQRVQHSIRQLQPALMVVNLSDAVVMTRETADASLRIHACHTRQRELEVLRDALLDALSAQPGRTPISAADMVVMAPDIAAYLPLIAAVFGPAGHSHAVLPYHLADVAVSRDHSLFATCLALLALPTARISAPEVMDLLAIPEIQRRLALDDDDIDQLRAWLLRSRVAWGLDGAARARFDVPAINEHTFAWALDRMIAGYLMADESPAQRDCGIRLADGCELAPLPGVHGPAAQAVGALHRLLQEVQAWCDLGDAELHATQWVRELDTRLHALLRIDASDSAARDAWQVLTTTVHSLLDEPQAVDEDPVLHFSVVRDLISERLQAVPEQQRLVFGGITFCGMVPQRAIPFKVIAVLGLNDGEFPRASHDGGLDLMASVRRIGDRDVRSDDRYLFLETLMSARERLHLSYLGQNVNDGKPRNPAAPLAELLGELDRHALGEVATPQRPWLVTHPLQPFDVRYFDGSDQRLFSYHQGFAQMRTEGQSEVLAPFVAEHEAVPLARISHHPSAADADPLAVTGRTPSSRLDVVSATSAPSSGPCAPPQRHLGALATKRGEKCGLAMPEPLPLAEVLAYYRDPAKFLLARQLALRLDALAESGLREEEPLSDSVERIENVTRRLFFDEALRRWPADDGLPERAPAWLRLTGLLPPGRAGVRAWQRERESVNGLLHALRQIPGFAGDSAAVATSHAVDVLIAGSAPQPYRVVGRVAQLLAFHHAGLSGMVLLRVFPQADGKLRHETELGFRERLPIFLEWALLRLHTARSLSPLPALRPLLLVADDEPAWQGAIQRWDDALLAADDQRRAQLLADLQARVARLLHWWQQAQVGVLWYFPTTSWQAAQRSADLRDRDAADADAAGAADFSALSKAWYAPWNGSGEREYRPGYNRLFAGERQFTDDEPECKRLCELAIALNDCINLADVSEARA